MRRKSFIFCMTWVLILCFSPAATANTNPVVWNNTPLYPAPLNIKERIESGLSHIHSISYEDIPTSLGIEFASIQNDRVLIQFERTPKRMTYLCVFDIDGNYLYGYQLFMRHGDTRLALSPNRDGILLLDWRVAKVGFPGVLVLSPDQRAEYTYYPSQNAYEDYSVWVSDYQLISKQNGRVIAMNTLTNEEHIIIDHSEAYAAAHTNQNNGMLGLSFLFLILIVCAGAIGIPALKKRLWQSG